MTRLAVALLALVACGAVIDETKQIGGDIAEVSYCEVAACGTVFLCSGGPLAMPSELCWIDDSASELATAIGSETTCSPTPRGGALGWPCLYSCTPHRGCNAFQGCWCGGGS